MPVPSGSATGHGACEILASGVECRASCRGKAEKSQLAEAASVRADGGTPRPEPAPILTLIQFGDSGREKSL